MNLTDNIFSDPNGVFPAIVSNVLPKYLNRYKELATEYIKASDYVLDIAAAGLDENQRPIFGICLYTAEGEQEWYDIDGNKPSIVTGWNSKDDARFALENVILPKIGYALQLKKNLSFYEYMSC